MSKEDCDILVNIIMLGDEGVGKTSLIHRFTTGKWMIEPIRSLDLQVKKLEVDEQRVRLHLWDTAGKERYNALSYKFYRGANGILLVYDITDRKTFDELNIWMDIINKNCHPSSNKILVGNKSDQVAKRKVSKEEGEAKAKALNMQFYECSARKSGVEVTDAIFKLLTATLDESPAGLLNLTGNFQKEDKDDVQKLLCSCCT